MSSECSLVRCQTPDPQVVDLVDSLGVEIFSCGSGGFPWGGNILAPFGIKLLEFTIVEGLKLEVKLELRSLHRPPKSQIFHKLKLEKPCLLFITLTPRKVFLTRS